MGWLGLVAAPLFAEDMAASRRHGAHALGRLRVEATDREQVGRLGLEARDKHTVRLVARVQQEAVGGRCVARGCRAADAHSTEQTSGRAWEGLSAHLLEKGQRLLPFPLHRVHHPQRAHVGRRVHVVGPKRRDVDFVSVLRAGGWASARG